MALPAHRIGNQKEDENRGDIGEAGTEVPAGTINRAPQSQIARGEKIARTNGRRKLA
jgi:hypothetical protein